MTNEQVEQITKLLQGTSASEWARIKQNIDMQFSSKQNKVTLDEKELELLNYNLKLEFKK